MNDEVKGWLLAATDAISDGNGQLAQAVATIALVVLQADFLETNRRLLQNSEEHLRMARRHHEHWERQVEQAQAVGVGRD